MSEALKKIKDYRKKILTNLYNKCTPEQQNLFNRMYKSLGQIPDTKIDWAIQQCERTVDKNKLDGVVTSESMIKRTGVEYTDELTDVEFDVFTDYLKWLKINRKEYVAPK